VSGNSRQPDSFDEIYEQEVALAAARAALRRKEAAVKAALEAASEVQAKSQHERRPLLTVEAASKRLGISPTTVYTAIKNDELAAIRLGRLIRISEEALADWIERSTVEARPRRSA
jgi:excisionase family DNA binding protein